MKTLSTLAIAALIASATFAAPQPGPGRGPGGPGPGFGPGGGDHPMIEALIGRMGDRIADRLDLTEAQRAEAKALAEALREDVQPLRESMQPLHENLRTALDATTPDAATVGGIVIQIEATRDQIKARADQFEADFEALLTPEQLEIWQRFQDHRDDHRGHGRRGGRG